MNKAARTLVVLRLWKLFFTGLALCCCFSANAQLQEFLLLEKPGTKHRIRYYIGDKITFKLRDEKGFMVGQLVQFSDTSFYIDDYQQIPIREVDALANRSKVAGLRNIGKTALFVIPGFFLLSAANNLFNTGDTPVIGTEVYPLAGIFAGVAGLAYLYKGRRYRLDNRWRIIMVRH